MKLKSKEAVDTYIEKLDKKELLTAIAECAEEFHKQGIYNAITGFANHVDRELVDTLDINDYLSILKDNNYSDPFKVYTIDMYSYSQKKNGKNFDKAFNQELIKILKDKSKTSGLRYYALISIDDYSVLSANLLEDIINSNDDANLKAVALKSLSKVNKIRSFDIAKNTIENHTKFTPQEVIMSMKVMYRSKKDFPLTEEEIDDMINIINNTMHTTKDKQIIEGSVFALGDIPHKISVNTVITNRDLINDDALITYFVDKNYLAVEKMLDNNSDSKTLDIALTCVEIAPFKSFLPSIEKLAQSHVDQNIKSRAIELANKITISDYQRNINWDNK